LFPDISKNSEIERYCNIHKDEELKRVFYVGMTRARQTLLIGAKSSKYAVKL
jgi:ATP-dependent exoDNAse (exonuclease V) beta subunit